MSLPMKVHFPDTVKNWQLWGKLVELWACGIQTLPKDVNALVAQAATYGLKLAVPGPQDRNVVFAWYDENKELSFILPTETC